MVRNSFEGVLICLTLWGQSQGWSQIFFAQKLGVTNAVLSNYERDVRDPDTATLKKIAELLEVSADYLLGLTDYRNVEDYKKESKFAVDWTEEKKTAAAAFVEQMRKMRGNMYNN
ncbi:helix-turn-helix domain-containing protein [Paenibacillus sp. WLX1005]|uniref:helix-turn-helix domain-containing protein n=1 Tax=Paenibacillus sp. WLX1005 TaxID=3243766 RepID=UPI003983DCDE